MDNTSYICTQINVFLLTHKPKIMKKFFSLITMFMLCLCGMAAETETVLKESYKIYVVADNGQAGTTQELYLNMKNRNAISKWSCTLELPNGVNFMDAEISNLENRYPDNYNAQLSASVTGNSISLTCAGTQGVTLNSQDGIIAVVTVTINSDVLPGTYEVYVKNTLLEEPNDAWHNYPDTWTLNWTIEEGAPVEQGTLIFNTDGGSEIAPITQNVGTLITAPEAPVKEGYTFVGWEPELPATMPEGENYYTAQWQVNTYPITFFKDENMKNIVEYIQGQEYGSQIVPPNTPDSVGHNFLGWFMFNAEGALAAMPETMPAHELSVFAQWEPMSFVVTVIGEGITVSNEYPNFGETVTITIEEKEDYAISGVLLSNQMFVPAVNGQVVIENVSYDFTVEAVYEPLVEFITPDQQYTMFSCAKDLDFSNSELKAYVAVGYSKPINYVLLQEIDVVPAGTGVMLIAPQTGVVDTYKIPYTPAQTQLSVENLFKANLDLSWITPVEFTETDNRMLINYALSSQDKTFAPLTGNGIELPAQSAYLQLYEDEVEQDQIVNFGVLEIIDAIANVKMNADENAMFDLQGRRVSKAAKGVYIVNGKKVLY